MHLNQHHFDKKLELLYIFLGKSMKATHFSASVLKHWPGRYDTKIKDFLQSVIHSSFCGTILCLLALFLKGKLGMMVLQLIYK